MFASSQSERNILHRYVYIYTFRERGIYYIYEFITCIFLCFEQKKLRWVPNFIFETSTYQCGLSDCHQVCLPRFSAPFHSCLADSPRWSFRGYYTIDGSEIPAISNKGSGHSRWYLHKNQWKLKLHTFDGSEIRVMKNHPWVWWHQQRQWRTGAIENNS